MDQRRVYYRCWSNKDRPARRYLHVHVYYDINVWQTIFGLVICFGIIPRVMLGADIYATFNYSSLWAIHITLAVDWFFLAHTSVCIHVCDNFWKGSLFSLKFSEAAWSVWFLSGYVMPKRAGIAIFGGRPSIFAVYNLCTSRSKIWKGGALNIKLNDTRFCDHM